MCAQHRKRAAETTRQKALGKRSSVSEWQAPNPTELKGNFTDEHVYLWKVAARSSAFQLAAKVSWVA
jgi:hypothetical protein